MHPLVRWQFRGGIAERDRKAFLFTNVTDSTGRRYDIPVVVGAMAANEEIYRIGMGVPLDQIDATWQRAMARADRAERIVERRALSRDRHHRRRAAQARQRARRHPDSDLDPRLGQRSVHDALAVHHQRSRYRRPKHGQLSRPGEVADALGDEPLARAAARHLRALGEVPRARRAHAGRGRARLSAVRSRSPRRRRSPSGSTSSRSRAAWSVRRSTSCARRPSICSSRPRPRSSSKATSSTERSRARSAVR